MLTADLVDARRKDGELLLRPLDEPSRHEALAVAAAYLDAARALVGSRREEIDEAWDTAAAALEPKRGKVAAGLRKLAADGCTFEAEPPVDPVELRRALFTRACAARRRDDAPFDRGSVLEETARALGIERAVVERAMFADLKGEHVLRSAPSIDAEGLVDAWELGQAQAVLLAAVKVTCEVGAGSPGLVRAFFAKLKFHKLLFSATPTASGWRVEIDGPFSMFDAVTKYGLRMAFILPALRSLERWSLVADIRWGKTRERLTFRLSSTSSSPGAPAGDEELHQSDDVRELAAAIYVLGSGWKAKPVTVLLEAASGDVCIPDLALTKAKGDEPIYVEVMGYWSRDAVFRRIELCERGLRAKVILCASSRLRVSEELLDDVASAVLYVYKGKMSPRAIVDRANDLSRE